MCFKDENFILQFTVYTKTPSAYLKTAYTRLMSTKSFGHRLVHQSTEYIWLAYRINMYLFIGIWNKDNTFFYPVKLKKIRQIARPMGKRR